MHLCRAVATTNFTLAAVFMQPNYIAITRNCWACPIWTTQSHSVALRWLSVLCGVSACVMTINCNNASPTSFAKLTIFGLIFMWETEQYVG